MEKSLMFMMFVAMLAFSCQAAELVKEDESVAAAKEQVSEQSGDLSSEKAPKGLIPILMLRKQNNPDFFLYFLQFYEPFIPQQVMDMIDSQVRPQTEQMSGQIISNVPGAEQAWAQMSQFQNILNQFIPSNMLGSLGGGGGGSGSGSNGSGRGRGDGALASLLQNMGRR